MRKFNLKGTVVERMKGIQRHEVKPPEGEAAKTAEASEMNAGFTEKQGILRFAWRTDVGRLRKNNQDAVILGNGLAGVADGTIDLTPYKTMPTVEKRNIFNATVSPTELTADFKTIGAAIADAEQKATKDTPYYILVKAGTYNEHVEINKPYIHLTGQSRDLVVITDNKSKSYNGNLGKTATVYVNASTRFTDGNEFGFGAEIGISTQKLHARGPMGLLALTTTKFIIYGNGQIRP